MQIDSAPINDNIKKIILSGRMDFAGTQEIDMKFTALTAAGSSNIIVDLADVEFIASIGIRTLVTNAKALKNKDKKMVLIHLADAVKQVLDTAGITAMIPAFDSEAEAVSAIES